MGRSMESLVTSPSATTRPMFRWHCVGLCRKVLLLSLKVPIPCILHRIQTFMILNFQKMIWQCSTMRSQIGQNLVQTTGSMECQHGPVILLSVPASLFESSLTSARIDWLHAVT